MIPDRYDAAADFTNPQSRNGYGYVLGMVDPTGLAALGSAASRGRGKEAGARFRLLWSDQRFANS
jgi:hypothetical protein